MHPVLFRIPLPEWGLPLFPALLVVAALGVGLAVFGRVKKAGDLLVIGAVAALGAGYAAFRNRGETFTLGEIPIYSYGAMLCLSIVVGWYLTLGLAKKDGLPKDTMANCYFVTAIAALIGSRLLYVVTNLDEFESFGDLFALRRGGLVAYGGFVGGFIGSWVFLRRQKLRLLPWADVAVPSLATGLMITRVGCYLFGCDFGKPLKDDAPGWLKKIGTFPRWEEGTIPQGEGSPAWIEHVNHRGLGFDAEASLPVHPTQIYESLAGLALLGLVFAVRSRQTFRGQVFLAFTFGYGFLRFLIEILRDDRERGVFGPFVAEHVYLPAALAIFAAAYGYGPARLIQNLTFRRLTQAVAVVPAVVAYFLLAPGSFATANNIQLSTSQWIGLLTAVAAAAAWSVYLKAAEAHPEAAMSLGLPGYDDAPEEDDAPSEDEAPVKKKKKKKKKTKKKKRKTADVEASPTSEEPKSKEPEPAKDDPDDAEADEEPKPEPA